jgi:hypothetical protein
MKISRRKFIAWFAVGAPLLAFLDGFFIERYFVETNEYFFNREGQRQKAADPSAIRPPSKNLTSKQERSQ